MPMPDDLPILEIDERNPLFLKNKFQTGIEKLDLLLRGGLNNKSTYLLQGEIKDQRIFCFHTIAKNRNKVCIYVTKELPYSKILELAKNTYLIIDNCIFIDMFAKASPINRVVFIENENISALMNAIKNVHAKTGNKFLLFIDSLSEIFSDKNSIYEGDFLKQLYIGVKNLGGSIIALSKQPEYGLRNNFDSVIEFSNGQIKTELLELPVDYKLHITGIEII